MSRRRDESGLLSSMVDAYGSMKSAYDAARPSRYRRTRRDVSGVGRPGDYHLSDRELMYQVELARELDRNDPVVGQGVTRVVDNVVQDGFTFDPNTGDAKVDDLLRDKVAAIHEDPDRVDVAGEQTFPEAEHSVCRSAIVDGDHLPVLSSTGAMEFMEFHRCRTPTSTRRNVVHGFLLDERRRRLEAWFTKEDVGTRGRVERVGDVKPMKVRDAEGYRQVLQVKVRPGRVSQTRGVTAVSPVADEAGMFGDMQFAMLLKGQMSACVLLLRELAPNAFQAGKVKPAQEGAREEAMRSDGSSVTHEGFQPGMDIQGRPGEKLQLASASVPNAEFMPYSMMVLSLIAVNLDLPVQVLLLDPTKTNFSGWRGALSQAQRTWRRMQKRLIERFHRPYMLFRLRHLLATDADVKSAYEAALTNEAFDLMRFRWIPPRWPYIQPVEDTTANHLRLRTGQTSPRRLAGEVAATEWKTIYVEQVDDFGEAVRYAKAKAIEINTDPELDDGQLVSWRELLPVIMGDRVSVGLTLPGGGEVGVGSGSDEEGESDG